MNVVQIPTNKPVIRKDLNDRLYKTEVEKFKAIVKDIEEIHKTGQPILAGTTSIEKSEILSYLLNLKGLKHEVLNAKNHEREAEIVKKAGKINSITIATNMAGRGTDISLGAGDKDEEEKVKSLGGLYVIGTEKHENRRIDNQLRGRSGRQGDPGISRFYVSLEDDLIRLFGSSKLKKIGEKMYDNEVLESKKLTKSIESAQINLESKNFGIRKEVLKYDDVINKQRNIIYNDRNKVLHGEDISYKIKDMIKDIVESYYSQLILDNDTQYYIEGIKDTFSIDTFSIEDADKNDILNNTLKLVNDLYSSKENLYGKENCRDFERRVLLHFVDRHWIDHIDALDQLKKVITLQAIGQKDPLKEYTVESFDMFDEMNKYIQINTVKHLYKSF